MMPRIPLFAVALFLSSQNHTAIAAEPLQQAIARAYATKKEADFQRAAELLEVHLERKPGDLTNRKSLGYLYLDKLHDSQRAIPHLEKVCASVPNDSGWRQMLARAYSGAGQHEAAARTYREVARRDPRDVWSRYHLGRALIALQRREDARVAFEEALAIDPKNQFARLELARLQQTDGRSREAEEMAREVLRADSGNPEAHALLGDIHRADWDLTGARSEYEAALRKDPDYGSAVAGLAELKKQQRRDLALAFYTFRDTEELRQTGVFSSLTLLVAGPFRLSGAANERWFEQSEQDDVARFESGLTLDYRPSRWAVVSGGVSQFKTEDQSGEYGGNIAIWVTPVPAVDVWTSYRINEPVNDSFLTAHDAFTQDIVAAGVNVRPTRTVTVTLRGSSSNYSDGNTRESTFAAVSWAVSAKAATTVKLEHEWLDFEERRPDYSSPQNYTLLRPAVEIAPQVTDWLKLQFRGELPYVFDEREWGTGLTVGPRITLGDYFELGAAYLNYRIPGGQTNWSGEGFKVDLLWRF